MSVHKQIESAFESWARFVVRFRWAVILSTLLVTAFFTSSLSELTVDNSLENQLYPDDPEVLRYNEFRNRFGQEDSIVIALNPPEVFSFDFLRKLESLHEDLERELPYVEEITSLINARNTRGEADELIVEDLMERWPQDMAELEALRERALGNPLYIRTLISEDARLTTLTIKPYTYSTLTPASDELAGFDEARGDTPLQEPEYLSDVEGRELVDVLRTVIARYESPDLPVYAAGSPATDVYFNEVMARDIAVFTSLAILVISLLLYLLFRRASAVVLPVAVSLFALLTTLGIMVRLGISLATTLEILPAFILVVGLCDSVHILTIFYQQLAKGTTKEEAITFALRHSGLAVLMTSLTTAGGLISFVAAELATIGHLGVVASIGVLLAMAYTLLLLPAALAVTPLSSKQYVERNALQGVLNRFLAAVADFAAARPWHIVAASVGILVVALAGVLQVRFSEDALRWLPEEDPIRAAAELIDRELGGSLNLEVLIDTGRENGLYEPDTLERIERAMRHVETLRVDTAPVGKVISIVDIVKEIHQALNENRPDYYVLPQERQLIAQELLLFENSGSDDLEEVTDNRFRTARLTIWTPSVDAFLYRDFVQRVEADLREILGEELPFELTGDTILSRRVSEAVDISMARSYALALLIITPLMILLIGSFRRGIVSMIPNLIPVYLALALMGWLEFPLNTSNLLVGAVIIGLAVDDTIHFMHKFNRYFEESGSARTAVHETLATTGAAILFTSLVLACGFSVFLFAYVGNVFQFGVLCVFSTIIALLADVILAPALMVLVTRSKSGGPQ